MMQVDLEKKGHRRTHPLNSLPLFLRDTNLLRPRRQRSIPLNILTQQLQELVGVLANELCELRVPGPNLLQYRLQHARLLLHDLP